MQAHLAGRLGAAQTAVRGYSGRLGATRAPGCGSDQPPLVELAVQRRVSERDSRVAEKRDFPLGDRSWTVVMAAKSLCDAGRPGQRAAAGSFQWHSRRSTRVEETGGRQPSEKINCRTGPLPEP